MNHVIRRSHCTSWFIWCLTSLRTLSYLRLNIILQTQKHLVAGNIEIMKSSLHLLFCHATSLVISFMGFYHHVDFNHIADSQAEFFVESWCLECSHGWGLPHYQKSWTIHISGLVLKHWRYHSFALSHRYAQVQTNTIHFEACNPAMATLEIGTLIWYAISLGDNGYCGT